MMESYSSTATYSIEDLENWNYPGTSLAVLGFPVKHSISPQMHNAALAAMRPACPHISDWKYFRFEIHPDRLIETLPLFHSKGFIGLNLTVPHKEIAINRIEKVDPSAQRIGAVNTLRRTSNGYHGFNTDGYGLEEGIKRKLGRQIEDSNFVLIGAGGAGRAAAMQAIERNCKALTIVNRNQERLSKLVDNVSPFAKEKGISVIPIDSTDESFQIPDNSLAVNATSLGLKSDDPLPVLESVLQEPIDLFDMIYNPVRTKLMETAKRAGGRVANGLSMLIHQGARALEIWSEAEVPDEAMSEAAKNALDIHN